MKTLILAPLFLALASCYSSCGNGLCGMEATPVVLTPYEYQPSGPVVVPAYSVLPAYRLVPLHTSAPVVVTSRWTVGITGMDYY